MQNTEISEHLKAQFLRMYSLALADDEFDAKELKYLYDLAKERGVSEDNLNNILLHPADVHSVVPATVEEKITYLYELSEIIWADEKVDENEIIALEHYIRLFEFEEESVVELRKYLINAVKENRSLSEILTEL